MRGFEFRVKTHRTRKSRKPETSKPKMQKSNLNPPTNPQPWKLDLRGKGLRAASLEVLGISGGVGGWGVGGLRVLYCARFRDFGV